MQRPAGLLGQAGLADPGLAGDDEEVALAGHRRLPRPVEGRSLGGPADERAARAPLGHGRGQRQGALLGLLAAAVALVAAARPTVAPVSPADPRRAGGCRL